MTINNQNRAAWIKLSYYLAIFIYLGLAVLLIYLNISNIYFTLGVISLFFFGMIGFSLSLHFNFIIYKETDDKVILRHYPLHPFHQNFKSIEIPKSMLSHFEIKSKIFGLRPEITLYQQTEKGLAKYPSVSLSSLSKSDKEKMLVSLRQNSSVKK